MNHRERLEKLTCVKLLHIIRKKLTVSETVARYDRAYTHYRALVLYENRAYTSAGLILDCVAYINALARYAAARGIHLKEVH